MYIYVFVFLYRYNLNLCIFIGKLENYFICDCDVICDFGVKYDEWYMVVVGLILVMWLCLVFFKYLVEMLVSWGSV